MGRKAGRTTDKMVDHDVTVAVKSRRRAMELFNEKDSYLSKFVDATSATYIEPRRLCNLRLSLTKLGKCWKRAQSYKKNGTWLATSQSTRT